MPKLFIKDFTCGQQVETPLAVVNLARAPFSTPDRQGEYYLRLTLADASGVIPGVIWDPSILTEEIGVDDLLLVSGEVKNFRGRQLRINKVWQLVPASVDRRLFQRSSARDPREMAGELHRMIGGITNPCLRGLLEHFFGDPVSQEKMLIAPGGRLIHHNYLGGLLEHTLEVADTGRHIAARYPSKISADLLITGALLHDIGKLEEYDLNSITFVVTDRGGLLGHISIGKEMLTAAILGMPAFPAALKMELEHMLLAHHGKKEWGSPEVPQTIHAYALFHADLVSARMNQLARLIDTQHGADRCAWIDFWNAVYTWGRRWSRSIRQQDSNFLSLEGPPAIAATAITATGFERAYPAADR